MHVCVPLHLAAGWLAGCLVHCLFLLCIHLFNSTVLHTRHLYLSISLYVCVVFEDHCSACLCVCMSVCVLTPAQHNNTWKKSLSKVCLRCCCWFGLVSGLVAPHRIHTFRKLRFFVVSPILAKRGVYMFVVCFSEFVRMCVCVYGVRMFFF